MSGVNETSTVVPEHVLALFGREYPMDPIVEGFPEAYYKTTVGHILRWYSAELRNAGRADLQKKNYTRPAPYHTWNAKTLGIIGVTDFILNLSMHMDRLFKATAAANVDISKSYNLENFIKRFREKIPGKLGARDEDKIIDDLKKTIESFGASCTQTCKALQILQCQVVDAILVNALAAVVTMQKGHIKMNEQLLIDSDPNCPILVSYTGSFHQDSAVLASNAENPAIILGPANNLVNEQYEEQYEEHRRSKVQRLF